MRKKKQNQGTKQKGKKVEEQLFLLQIWKTNNWRAICTNISLPKEKKVYIYFGVLKGY